MSIEIGSLREGKLVIASNEKFPAHILRVEYYAEQRLFMFVYNTPDQESQLMPYEVSTDFAKRVECSPNIMVIIMAENGEEPYGYDVPLVKVTH